MSVARLLYIFIFTIIVIINSAMAQEFNFKVDLPPEFHSVMPGDKIFANVQLSNLGSTGRVDVVLDYWVSMPNNTAILSSSETVAVETQANFVKTVQLPANLPPGAYVLHAKITSSDRIEATAYQGFNVGGKPNNMTKIYVGSAVLIIISIISFSWRFVGQQLKNVWLKMSITRIVKNKLKSRKNR